MRRVPRGRGWWRRTLLAGAVVGVAGAGWVAWPLPSGLLDAPNDESVTLLSRSGIPLRTTRDGAGARRSRLALSELDPDLLVAFVAVEDRRFFEHAGVDPLAVARATRQNLRAGRVISGASTITMQLARLLRANRRTWGGKLAQALWALRLDAHLSKQAILAEYLNRVPLGEGAIGVDAAARLYLGQSARSVSLGQAALLAGLAGAPSRDNPLASLERARSRRDLVLDRLTVAGLELPDALARARTEPLLGQQARQELYAPHFIAWVLRSGLRSTPAKPSAERRGPRAEIRTTIDLSLQGAIESEVRHTAAEMRSYGAEHAAAVVLDNRTGEILAWVGSPDFFEPVTGQVDMVISTRQPGSTMKPFLYGLAFDRGFTPASLLQDVATVYRTAGGPYAPRNYDRRFRGPVRIREALGSSYNVPAVELASRLGPAALLATLGTAGFASLDRRADHYGLGLALGNGEVTLLELANGYRALANGGIWRPVRWIASGEAGPSGEERVVMSQAAAAQVIDILADPAARIPGFGPSTPLEFPFRAAAKTGTSRHFTDNWAVTTTAGFTVAVWVGNFNGRPMDGVSGITGAGPLLHRAVLAVAARRPPGSLILPNDAGLVATEVCRLSGLRAAGRCQAITEWFRPGTEPGPDTWFGPGGITVPAEHVQWAGQSTAGVGAGIARVAEDTVRNGFHIVSPRHGDTYRFVPGVDPKFATIALRAGPSADCRAPRAKCRVEWFVDGRRHEAARWALVPGLHRIRAVAGAESDEVTVEVIR